MPSTRSSSFPSALEGRVRAAAVLAEHEHDIAEWARDRQRPRRLALRSTFAEDVGVLSSPGMLLLPVADVVVVLELAASQPGGDGAGPAPRVELLAALPEATPGWAVAAAALHDVDAARRSPYPRLEQVALCWLGQDWAAGGATTAAAAVSAWAATAGDAERTAVRREAEDLIGIGLDPRDLGGLLVELGAAVPGVSGGELLALLISAAAP